METLSKWNLKIANIVEENEDLVQKVRGMIGWIMKQIDLHPHLSFISLTVIIFLIIVSHPWILIVIGVSFFSGFHSTNFLQKNLSLVIAYVRRKQGGNGNVHDIDPLMILHDPLLNNGNGPNNIGVHGPGSNLKDSSESSAKESQHKIKTPEKEKHTVRTGCSRLKINSQLDKSIAHFCTLVFQAYISPEWAPYETRKQLKLAFVKLLTNFAERVLDTFSVINGGGTNCYGVSFCRDKIIPLAFRHIRNGQQRKGKSLSSQELNRALWKVRRLCRTLLEDQLSQDDQKCLLWMELCVSVLADGVIWNLILLGRTELPILIEAEAKERLNITGLPNEMLNQSSSTSQKLPASNIQNTDCDGIGILNRQGLGTTPPPKAHDETDSIKPEIEIRIQTPDQEPVNISKNLNTSAEKSVPNHTTTPFLLDNFLDPSLDVEQAAMIISRWRPTLKDILNERELLYVLIQYLRKEKALEFLQAVLDDSQDGSEYCRKILELEYLPGFCRSRIFLESLGLNRVDEVGLEAGVDSNTLKKPVGHTRSASYGSEREALPGMKLWKIEQRAVDGIAIYNNKIPPIPFQEIASVENTDSIFRRRHVLEPFITKFFNSINNFGKYTDPLAEPEVARRLGIDFKEYDDFFHPEVMTTTSVDPCDILAETSDLFLENMTKHKWFKWVASGWLKILHPLMKPKFDLFLDGQIADFLSVDNFVQFVDLISDAFLNSVLATPLENDLQKPDLKPQAEFQPNRTPHSSELNPSVKLATGILKTLFDVNGLICALNDNGDEFVLFCVDLLDILVSELTNVKKQDTTPIKLLHSKGVIDIDVNSSED